MSETIKTNRAHADIMTLPRIVRLTITNSEIGVRSGVLTMISKKIHFLKMMNGKIYGQTVDKNV